MPRIHPVDESTQDPQKLAAVKMVADAWGSSWNVTSTIANNPKIIEGFMTLWEAVENSGLSKTDREVICMEMARSNGCHYCIPAHRHVAQQNDIDTDMIEQIASGQLLEGDGREATIQRLANRLQETRGKLSDEEFAEFHDHGVSVPDMIAVIAEIAHCTITNFTNRLAQTELDPFLEAYIDGQPQ